MTFLGNATVSMNASRWGIVFKEPLAHLDSFWGALDWERRDKCMRVSLNIIQHFPSLFLQTHLYLPVHFSTIVLFTLSHLCTSISIVFLFINTFPHPHGLHILIPEKKEELNFLEIDLKYEDENSEVDFEEMKVLVGGRMQCELGDTGQRFPVTRINI